MVVNAAKNAGYKIKAFHGTSNDFWVFKKGKKRTRGSLNLGDGFYFAPNRSSAENYTNTGRVIEGFLKLEKPYVFWGTRFYQDDLDRISQESGKEVTIENVADVLKDMGYDGIIARDYNGTTNPINQYVIFGSNQIKLADAIVYDDNDNIIPISERFNETKDDIRYSTQQADISDREMLANAFENLAQNSEEYKRLQEYKDMASTLTRLDRELQDINQQIRDIRFSKDPRDNKSLPPRV